MGTQELGDERDLAGGVTAGDHAVGRGRLGQRERLGHDHAQCAVLGQPGQFQPGLTADLGSGIGPGPAAENVDAGVGAPGERGDGGDPGPVGDERE